MAHWLEDIYGRVGEPVTERIRRELIDAQKKLGKKKQAEYGNSPIKYTSAMDKPLHYATPASETAVAITDERRYASVFNSKQRPKGYGGRVWDSLTRAGFIFPNLNFTYAMLYMESGKWTNRPALIDNNPGNIMWYPGAKKGVYVAANKTYAAHFDNLDKFALQLAYELRKGANPLGAQTLEDFVHRLKLNNYFGKESEESYYRKVKGALNDLGIWPDMTNPGQGLKDLMRGKEKDYTPKKPFKMPIWGWVLVGVGGLVVLKNVTK